MAVSQTFIDMLRDALAPLGPVTIRKMFGGAGIYAEGVMFGLIDGDALYLKGDPAAAAKFEAEGCPRFVYDGQTGPVAMSYWRAPERLFDDPEAMLEWARDAIAAARAAAARKSRAKPPAAAKRAAAKRR